MAEHPQNLEPIFLKSIYNHKISFFLIKNRKPSVWSQMEAQNQVSSQMVCNCHLCLLVLVFDLAACLVESTNTKKQCSLLSYPSENYERKKGEKRICLCGAIWKSWLQEMKMVVTKFQTLLLYPSSFDSCKMVNYH